MRVLIKIIFVLLLFVSCTTSSQGPDVYPDFPDPKFKAQIKFSVDNQWYIGTASLQRKTSNKITFLLPKNTNLLLINTCGREDEFWTPGEKVEYNFIPGMWKENVNSCILTATAITTGGEYHRAAIDFSNSLGKDLSARVFCNGVWLDVTGGSYLCQTRAGLLTGIKFDVETIGASDVECQKMRPITSSPTGWEYEWEMSPGFCAYDFIDQQKRRFRFTTLGYTSILNIYPPVKGK
jgi:hypothetical protein